MATELEYGYEGIPTTGLGFNLQVHADTIMSALGNRPQRR